jgi:hypothetical protein
MAPLLIPMASIGSSRPAPSEYWISTLSTTVFEGSQDVAIDSNNNIFHLGFDSDTLAEAILTKYDFMGNVIFMKKFKTSTNREAYISSVELDSSDNLCVVGCAFDTNSSKLDYTVIKFDNNGDILWQKVLYDGTNGYNSFHDKLVDVDSSGNIYGMTQTSLNPSTNVYISDRKMVKLNSSGSLLTQRHFADSRGRGTSLTGLKVRKSTGEVHVCGNTNAGSFSTGIATVFKTNNVASNAIWSKELPSTISGDYSSIVEMDIDESGNVYILGFESGQSECFLVKFNSSGVVQWQRKTPYASGAFWLGVEVHSATNSVYVTGRDQSGAYTNGLTLFRFDSSGNLQWQRVIDNLGYFYTRPISISNDGSTIILAADKNTAYVDEANLVTIRLPSDGSLIGNHNGNNYVQSSYTISTYSGAWTGASMYTQATSAASTTLSIANATYIPASTTYEQNRVDIR